MPYEICRHIKTNGRRCGSPALTNEHWCFFHHRFHHGHHINRYAKPIARPDSPNLALPALADREAIQIGISVVVAAIANNLLDPRRASALLRGLQIAAKNTVALSAPPDPEDIARSYTPTLDGFALAPRQMDDNSEPAPRPRVPFPDEDPPQYAVS